MSIEVVDNRMETINNIVEMSMTNKDTGTRKYNIPKYTEVKNYGEFELEDEFVDLNREYKDIFTNFVVNELVKTPDNVFEFLKLIYNIFDDAIELYIKKKGLPIPTDERLLMNF